jgi:replicative DNA helicase
MTDLIDPHLAAQFDRIAPCDIPAEQSLIASMMIDRECIGDVVQIITTREMLYQADHQILFSILVKLYEDAAPIDAIIVRDELVKRQMLEEIGGAAYLGQLLGMVPSAAHARHYAGIVREKYLLRSLISVSNETLRDAYAPHEKADALVDRAEQRVLAISENKVAGGLVPTEEFAEETLTRLLDKDRPRGLETGFVEIDGMLNGLQNGDMIVVAARPSQGKTALAMNIVEHVAIIHGQPVAVFSLEMTKDGLLQRMFCSVGEVDNMKLRQRMTSAEDDRKLAAAMVRIAAAPIVIDDSPQATVTQIRAKCRRTKQQRGLALILIDYMQLMDEPGVTESRQQQVTAISKGIKSVAKELMVPVVALSQLNRGSESREGHRPRMSDLRESGSIEQDADVIMLLHREDQYHLGEQDYQFDNLGEVIIAKQRQGPTGSVKLVWDGTTSKFRNLSSHHPAF